MSIAIDASSVRKFSVRGSVVPEIMYVPFLTYRFRRILLFRL